LDADQRGETDDDPFSDIPLDNETEAEPETPQSPGIPEDPTPEPPQSPDIPEALQSQQTAPQQPSTSQQQTVAPEPQQQPEQRQAVPSDQENEAIPQIRGRDARIRTSQGSDPDAQFALVDANDLEVSNDAQGNTNPQFPQELQPRNRSRHASHFQIQQISQNLRPEELGDTGRAENGAPVIGPDGVVESGNARAAAIQQAFESGNGEGLRQFLRDNADQFGFEPEAVDAIDNPVLTRVRTDDRSGDERAQFAREANQSDIAPRSAAEQAQADAQSLSDADLQQFNPDESGNVLAASNRDFLQRFAARIGDLAAGGLQTSDGRFTKQMVDRVRNAVFAKAYGDERLIALAAEEADPGVRSILTALQQAAPAFARARGIDETLGAFDVVTPIVEGTEIIISARNNNQSVEELLGQDSLFGDGPSAKAGRAARFMANHKRSAKRMGEGFRVMGEFVESELRRAQNESLFGDDGATLNDVFDRANQHLEERYAIENALGTDRDLLSGGSTDRRDPVRRPDEDGRGGGQSGGDGRAGAGVPADGARVEARVDRAEKRPEPAGSSGESTGGRAFTGSRSAQASAGSDSNASNVVGETAPGGVSGSRPDSESAQPSPDAEENSQDKNPVVNVSLSGRDSKTSSGKAPESRASRIFKRNGDPYQARKQAEIAARGRQDLRGRDLQAVAVDGGWALERTQEGNTNAQTVRGDQGPAAQGQGPADQAGQTASGQNPQQTQSEPPGDRQGQDGQGTSAQALGATGQAGDAANRTGRGPFFSRSESGANVPRQGDSTGGPDARRNRSQDRAGRAAGADSRATAGEVAGRSVGGAPRVGWDSATRVVSVRGQPRRVYRGASRPASAESFDPQRLGGATGHPSAGLGVWFTSDHGEASQYGATVEDFYLDIRNPKVYRAGEIPQFESVSEASRFRERLRGQGFDGIAADYRDVGGPVHFAAFDAEQAIYPDSAPRFSRGEAAVPEGIEPAPANDTAFKRWFGDSKVVDANGDPQVVYHGTFTEFDRFQTPAFFTEEADAASAYAGGQSPNVVPSYLRIKNPPRVEWLADIESAIGRDLSDSFDYVWEALESAEVMADVQNAGYDGVRLIDDQTPDSNRPHDTWVVFRPEQVKSAVGNRGTFDPSDERITFQRGRSESISVDRARQKAASLMRDWEDRPPTYVRQGEGDLPEALQSEIRNAGAEGEVRGVYWRGSAYLIADNIASERALEETVLHEIVGHYGLRKVLGQDAKPLFRQVWMQYGRSGLADVAQRQGLDLSDAEDQLIAAEEKLAELAESGAKPRLLDKLKALLRDWLRRMGFSLQLSDSELLALVAKARSFVERGRVVRGQESVIDGARTADVGEAGPGPGRSPSGDCGPRYVARRQGQGRHRLLAAHGRSVQCARQYRHQRPGLQAVRHHFRQPDAGDRQRRPRRPRYGHGRSPERERAARAAGGGAQ